MLDARNKFNIFFNILSKKSEKNKFSSNHSPHQISIYLFIFKSPAISVLLLLTSLLPPDDKGTHTLHSGVVFHPFPLLLISHYPRQLQIVKNTLSGGWRLNAARQAHKKIISNPSPRNSPHVLFHSEKWGTKHTWSLQATEETLFPYPSSLIT